ncbi:THO complex subunit 4-like [Dysidea avara]|uniref:THO complex subunit 4-like n=1 Tax=Dysidea avara TaxID=196820 RepID=UPI0033342BFA
MSDGKVDMSLDDIIRLGGRGRGGRGRGAGRGMRGRGRGRGVGMGRGAGNQQRNATRQLQQRGRGNFQGRGTFRGRAQGRGFRRGGSFAGRGQTRTLSTNTGFNKQQLGVKSGGIVKRRIGNLRGRARGGGRGGMLNLKTAIRSQLQTQQSPSRGRGRGRGANRGGRNPTNTTQEPFKNFQVSVKGLGSQANDAPEGVQMVSTFSVNHTTGITLNNRFTPNEASKQSTDRLITANGRAVKHF